MKTTYISVRTPRLKFSDVRFAISPRKIVKTSCKTSRSRDNFIHFAHISEQSTIFSFSGHLFFTVNTVVYVYRDNEPVQDRMRQQHQPLTKHIQVISTKNLSKFGSRFLAMSQIHTLRFVFGAKLIINQRVCHGIDWQN